MADERDDLIRELAKSHGVDNLPDDQLRDIKSTLSVSYIDSVLDGSFEPKETQNGTDGKV